MNRRHILAAGLVAPFLGAGRTFAAERLIGWISPESAEATAPFFSAMKAGLTAALPAGGEPMGIELTPYRAHNPGEIRTALTQALDSGAQAIVMLPSSSMVQLAPPAAADCIARKVPLVSGWAAIARAGGLLTYGLTLPPALLAQADEIIE